MLGDWVAWFVGIARGRAGAPALAPARPVVAGDDNDIWFDAVQDEDAMQGEGHQDQGQIRASKVRGVAKKQGSKSNPIRQSFESGNKLNTKPSLETNRWAEAEMKARVTVVEKKARATVAEIRARADSKMLPNNTQSVYANKPPLPSAHATAKPLKKHPATTKRNVKAAAASFGSGTNLRIIPAAAKGATKAPPPPANATAQRSTTTQLSQSASNKRKRMLPECV